MTGCGKSGIRKSRVVSWPESPWKAELEPLRRRVAEMLAATPLGAIFLSIWFVHLAPYGWPWLAMAVFKGDWCDCQTATSERQHMAALPLGQGQVSVSQLLWHLGSQQTAAHASGRQTRTADWCFGVLHSDIVGTIGTVGTWTLCRAKFWSSTSSIACWRRAKQISGLLDQVRCGHLQCMAAERFCKRSNSCEHVASQLAFKLFSFRIL